MIDEPAFAVQDMYVANAQKICMSIRQFEKFAN